MFLSFVIVVFTHVTVPSNSETIMNSTTPCPKKTVYSIYV